MNRQALITKLGLNAEATDDEILAAIEALKTTSETAPKPADLEAVKTERDAAANARDIAETALKDAEKERDEAVNAREAAEAELKTAREVAANAKLDAAIAAGKITKATRQEWFDKLTGENREDAENAFNDLKPLRNTSPLDLRRSRHEVGEESQRREAIANAVDELMKGGMPYDEAFSKVRKDPNFKPIFDAMKRPDHVNAD